MVFHAFGTVRPCRGSGPGPHPGKRIHHVRRLLMLEVVATRRGQFIFGIFGGEAFAIRGRVDCVERKRGKLTTSVRALCAHRVDSQRSKKKLPKMEHI